MINKLIKANTAPQCTQNDLLNYSKLLPAWLPLW